MALKFTGSFGPITGAMKLGNSIVTLPYFYMTQFDISSSGTGSYTLNDTQVSGMTHVANEWQNPVDNSVSKSKLLLKPEVDTNETRFRFRTPTVGNGIQPTVWTDTGYLLFDNFMTFASNWTDVRYRKSDNSYTSATRINPHVDGPNVIREIRIIHSGSIEYYIDDVLVWNVSDSYVIGPGKLHVRFVELSNTKSSVLMLPGE